MNSSNRRVTAQFNRIKIQHLPLSKITYPEQNLSTLYLKCCNKFENEVWTNDGYLSPHVRERLEENGNQKN